MRTILLTPRVVTNEQVNIVINEEGIVLEANHSIEDVWINSPNVEIEWRLTFPHEETSFPLGSGFLIPAKNDPKEFNNIRSNRMAFRTTKGSGLVYFIFQRN